jgi:hypothetical protein
MRLADLLDGGPDRPLRLGDDRSGIEAGGPGDPGTLLRDPLGPLACRLEDVAEVGKRGARPGEGGQRGGVLPHGQHEGGAARTEHRRGFADRVLGVLRAVVAEQERAI